MGEVGWDGKDVTVEGGTVVPLLIVVAVEIPCKHCE